MPSKRILIVEDDAAIRRGIADALRSEGYGILEAPTAREGVQRGLRSGCDLILLDLILPDGSGLDVLTEVRASHPTLPVIILTALGEAADRVKGLKLGADDYVVKPFGVDELLARVSAVLRRSAERPCAMERMQIAGGTVDFLRREISFTDGSRVSLTEREGELLAYLASNAGRVVERAEILSRVWGVSPNGASTRTIDMHVARLREKLRDDAANPVVIRTVHGKGYVLATETP